jgi:hypothetical protein
VTTLLAVAGLTLAVLLALGTIEVRFGGSQPRPSDPAPSPASPKEPKQPWIREIANAEPYFELLGKKARLFEYKGGLIDAWIEVEVEGQVTVLKKMQGALLREFVARNEAAAPVPSGYLVWTRRENNEEVWELALSINSQDGKIIGWTRDDRISFPGPHAGGSGFEVSGRIGGGDGAIPLDEGQAVVLAWFRNGESVKATRKVELKCQLTN